MGNAVLRHQTRAQPATTAIIKVSALALKKVAETLEYITSLYSCSLVRNSLSVRQGLTYFWLILKSEIELPLLSKY